MEVYVEDVFILNFAADFALLFCTLKICGQRAFFGRLVFSAAVGAIFAFVIIDCQNSAISLALKLFEGVVLLLPLKIKKEKLFGSLVVLVFLSLSLFGILSGVGVLLKNDDIFRQVDIYCIFDESPIFSVISCSGTLVLFVFVLSANIKRRKRLAAWVCKVTVFFSLSKPLELVGFIDSGNLLFDEKTELSIPVVNYFAIAAALDFPSFERLSPLSVRQAGGNSSLKSLKIPKVVIKTSDKEYIYNEILFCVSMTGFGDEFDVLVPPALVEGNAKG